VIQTLLAQLPKFKSRDVLIGVAGVLLLLNVGRLGLGKYEEARGEIESRQALLGQYRHQTQGIDDLRRRVRALEAERARVEKILFVGDSRQEITSAMQIKLQEMLGKANLAPESLQPTGKDDKESGKLYGEILIKMRLSGTLESLLQFFSVLYRDEHFFKIENFTLKPFKKDEIKVFLELKGFYRIQKAAGP